LFIYVHIHRNALNTYFFGMQHLPKIIYTRVLIVCIFINPWHDISLHTLVDDNDISPVLNTSTDHKKSNHVHYLTSNTILICMHSVKHCISIQTERIQQYKQEAARLVTGEMSFIYVSTCMWTLGLYHHQSIRHSPFADE
jgi:hypothetical protein